MIKIKEFATILESAYDKNILSRATEIFKSSLESSALVGKYVEDFADMKLPDSIYQQYYNEGLSVLMPAVNSKKKLDINSVSKWYIVYTGLLNREFVIGYDTTKGMVTSIFTKNEYLLNLLNKAGAFDNTEKFQKGMKALFGEGNAEFGNKVVSSFEKQSLALGRIDISCVIGDEVSLDLVIPNKFRTDYGDTFKLYPYSVFPYLATSLEAFVNGFKEKSFQEKNKKVIDIRAITVQQIEPKDSNDDTDSQQNIKIRRVCFKSDELVKAYRRGSYRMDQVEEAQELLKNQIHKTKLGWDCVKLQMRAFNLEASLYSIPYSVIKFERITNISPCRLRDIDTSLYLVDFDMVRRLFRARVNNWKLNDFKEFNKIFDTDSCMNIPDRCQMIDVWANSLDDADLFKIMKMKRNLFEPEVRGVKKTIEAGLDDMFNQKPSAAKRLSYVELESDFTARKKQLQDLLQKGVCKIESSSTRTGAYRMYLATSNDAVLNAAYGPKKLLQFESTKRSIERISEQIKNSKINNIDRFVKALHDAEIDGIVDYSQLGDTSVPADWLQLLGETYLELENNSKDKAASSNPYLVSFRRINADSEKDFYGSVDVRNIDNLEFGEQKIRKTSPKNV